MQSLQASLVTPHARPPPATRTRRRGQPTAAVLPVVPQQSTPVQGPGHTVLFSRAPSLLLARSWSSIDPPRPSQSHGQAASRAGRLQRCRSGRPGPMPPSEPETAGALNPNLPGNPFWWEELEGEKNEEDFSLLTPDEVSDRVEEAAALISVLDDLRPMHQEGYNAFAEVWTRLVRVPPSARCRVLNELEPGAIRSLWKASMSRYVLPDGLAMHLLGGFSILEDFPTEPGEVAEYEGLVEVWQYKRPDTQFSVDAQLQGRYPRSQPWLKPNPGSMVASRKRFTMHFFLHPRTGALHARLTPQVFGPISAWWLPLYLRVRPGLVLTPLDADAGADMTFEYGPIEAARAAALRAGGVDEGLQLPTPGRSFRQDLGYSEEWSYGAGVGGVYEGEELLREDLPVAQWPRPWRDEEMPLSPFSGTHRDFVRVAGPGMYVGCGYPLTPQGVPDKDACVFFAVARKT